MDSPWNDVTLDDFLQREVYRLTPPNLLLLERTYWEKEVTTENLELAASRMKCYERKFIRYLEINPTNPEFKDVAYALLFQDSHRWCTLVLPKKVESKSTPPISIYSSVSEPRSIERFVRDFSMKLGRYAPTLERQNRK